MIIELYKGTIDYPYQTEQADSAPQNAAQINHTGIHLPASLPGLTCCTEQPGSGSVVKLCEPYITFSALPPMLTHSLLQEKTCRDHPV